MPRISQTLLVFALSSACALGCTGFQQVQCTDDNCSLNCKISTFCLNQCYGFSGMDGSSITLSCSGSGISSLDYQSSQCSGVGHSDSEPVGTCLKAGGGGSFMNTCVSDIPNAAPGPSPTPKRFRVATPIRSRPTPFASASATNKTAVSASTGAKSTITTVQVCPLL